MEFKRAEASDIEGILRLLKQVNKVHYDKRPDIFNLTTKYSKEELAKLIEDDTRPIFVAKEEKVLGYAFCIIRQDSNNKVLKNIKQLYIDDLCVDEKIRGKHIGTFIYQNVLKFAASISCYNITLNVWELNDAAKKFYLSMGFSALKTEMEKIIEK